MSKIFFSSIDDVEIIDTIIDYLDDSDVNSLVSSNVMLRFLLRSNKANKKKFDRVLIDEKLKHVYKQDINLKRAIVKRWNLNVIYAYNSLSKATNINEYIDSVVEENIPLEMFEHCTVLWRENDQIKNKLGDELYEKYKKAYELEGEEILNKIENRNKTENREEDTSMKSDNDIMNISIGEFIERAKSQSNEIEKYKNELDKKQAELDSLKKLLDNSSDARELKKEFKTLTKKIADLQNILLDRNNTLEKELLDIKKENVELKKSITKISNSIDKISPESLTKLFIKSLVDIQTDAHNSLKGGIIDGINKNVDTCFKNIAEKIDTLCTSPTATINPEPVVQKNTIDKKIPEPQKTKSSSSTQDSNGLAEILKGLGTSL